MEGLFSVSIFRFSSFFLLEKGTIRSEKSKLESTNKSLVGIYDGFPEYSHLDDIIFVKEQGTTKDKELTTKI